MGCNGPSPPIERLLDDPPAITQVAGMALRVCHFDPETGDDLRRAPNAREDAEATDSLTPDYERLFRGVLVYARERVAELTATASPSPPCARSPRYA